MIIHDKLHFSIFGFNSVVDRINFARKSPCDRELKAIGNLNDTSKAPLLYLYSQCNHGTAPSYNHFLHLQFYWKFTEIFEHHRKRTTQNKLFVHLSQFTYPAAYSNNHWLQLIPRPVDVFISSRTTTHHCSCKMFW